MYYWLQKVRIHEEILKKDQQKFLFKEKIFLSTYKIADKEIEVLIIASVETLKRQKSQCGIYEVFKLVKDTIKENITREIFDKTLESLIESGLDKFSTKL